MSIQVSDRRIEGGLRSGGTMKRWEPEKPVVSVITVVLDNPEALTRTIESVLAQTYHNIEYIIIDGGSDEKTLDLIKKQEDKVDYWMSEKDRGIYDAMNKGVERATGCWVIFMNAGDTFYESDTVEKVFQKIPEHADFLYGDTVCRYCDRDQYFKAYGMENIWKSMMFFHQSCFTRKDILTGHKFSLSYETCSDFELIFHSYIDGRRFHYVDQIISIYEKDGISEKKRLKMILERWKIVRKINRSFQMDRFYLSLLVKRTLQRIMRKDIDLECKSGS